VTPPALRVTPIGTLRTAFPDRASAPRQPAAARGAVGTIELFPDGRFEHALADLDGFSHIWVLFWFHLNEGWRGKVLPPRSATRRGVFATRSPYRPNPIGLSVVRLDRIEGLVLHVLDVDMIDGTPVLDIKPYLAYTDAVATTGHGWLDESEAEGPAAPDPRARFAVEFAPVAREQLEFLSARFDVDLAQRISEVLALGPSPHPYRRIRKDGYGFRLAVREWRAVFRVETDAKCVTVERILSGYRPSVLFGSTDPALEAHRAYVERFGADGDRDRAGESPP
jgi:tRNA-Thr(GGU) m(6)t(6)A37 methyltransferase TsaA